LRADRKASNGSLGGPFLFNVLPLDRTKLSGRFGQFGRTTPTVWNWPIAEAAEPLFFELREQLRQLVACLAHRMSYR
jgi:hypothetical protein